jgi:hypothetical protein
MMIIIIVDVQYFTLKIKLFFKFQMKRKTYSLVTHYLQFYGKLLNAYKYGVSGQYPSSCFYLKTECFGDWILSVLR